MLDYSENLIGGLTMYVSGSPYAKFTRSTCLWW